MQHKLIILFACMFVATATISQTIHADVLEAESGGYYTTSTFPQAFLVDNQGSYYTSINTVYEASFKRRTYFELTKYDSTGNILWSRNLGQDNTSGQLYDLLGAWINGMCLDDSDGIYIVGNLGAEDEIKFDPFVFERHYPSSSTDEKSFAAKINRNTGELIWLMQDDYQQNSSTFTDVEYFQGNLYISYGQESSQELICTSYSGYIGIGGSLGIIKASTDGTINDHISINGHQSYIGMFEDPLYNGTSYLGRSRSMGPTISMNDNGEIAILCNVGLSNLLIGDEVIELRLKFNQDWGMNLMVVHVNADFTWGAHSVPIAWDRRESKNYPHRKPIFYLDNDRNVHYKFAPLESGYDDMPVFQKEDLSFDSIVDGSMMNIDYNGEISFTKDISNEVKIKNAFPINNGYLMLGQFKDFMKWSLLTIEESYGLEDLFIGVFNNSNVLLKMYVFGSLGTDTPYLCYEANDNIYLLGSCQHRLKYDNQYLTNEDDAVFVLTFDSQDVDDINESGYENNILIYPNPTTNQITINSSKNNTHFQLTNLNGQVIIASGICEESISLEGIPPGVYVATILEGDEVIGREKLIVK